MNFDTEKIIKLYEQGLSIRGVCRKLNISEGWKTNISNLLSGKNIQVRKGKMGIKVGSIITEICPSCKKEKRIKLRKLNQKPKLCVSCATAKSHKDNPRIGRAENHYNWRGGTNLNRQGYIIEYVKKTHQFFPMATNSHNAGGYILQHRLVMANHLRRCLKPYEIVHHVDGNRQNNRIENLKMTVRQKHGLAYSDAFQEGFKQGYEEARQKYDMSRQGYHDVEQYYKE